MTLPLSGPLSLERIKSEAFGGGTLPTPFSLNDADIRALALKNTPNSLIKISDCYGKGRYTDHLIDRLPNDPPGGIPAQIPIYVEERCNPPAPVYIPRGTLTGQVFKSSDILFLESRSGTDGATTVMVVSGLRSGLFVTKFEFSYFDGTQKRCPNVGFMQIPATDDYEAQTRFAGWGTYSTVLDWQPSVPLLEGQVMVRAYW